MGTLTAEGRKVLEGRGINWRNPSPKNIEIANRAGLSKVGAVPGVVPGVTPTPTPTPGFTPIQYTANPVANQEFKPIDYTPNAINDSTGQINALADASKASTLARMERSRNIATSGLAGEKTLAQQGQITQLGQARTGAATGARNFSEYLASKGLSNSGSVGQGQMANNIGLMAQEGSINQNLGNTLQDIEGKRNLADQNYDTGVADSYANIEADRARGLIDNTSSMNTQNTANANRLYDINVQNQAGVTEQNRWNTEQNQTEAERKAEIDRQNLQGATEQTRYNEEQIANAIRAKAIADQQKIENAFNQGQITRDDAETRRRKVVEDRNYQLNLKQLNYQTGKPYYNPKSGKGGKGGKGGGKGKGKGKGGGKKNDGLGGFYN